MPAWSDSLLDYSGLDEHDSTQTRGKSLRTADLAGVPVVACWVSARGQECNVCPGNWAPLKIRDPTMDCCCAAVLCYVCVCVCLCVDVHRVAGREERGQAGRASRKSRSEEGRE
eukprot:1591352-Rhodomonas_salina.1